MLEILELVVNSALYQKILDYLETLAEQDMKLTRLIREGIEMIKKEK